MIAVISLLLVVTLSLMVTKVAAVALSLTGLSLEAARFQARSAFPGVGFTTEESESITGHPVRRRIVMLLMLLGNLGVASVVATSIISYMNVSKEEYGWLSIAVLLGGLLLLWLFMTNKVVEKWLNKSIQKGLKRWTNVNVQDYIAIMHLQQDYAISELSVEAQDWLADKSLLDSELSKEGVLVLGIQRKEGVYLGAPRADIVIKAGDVLILYGPINCFIELDKRRKGRVGERAHERAIEKFNERAEKEQLLDEQRLEE